MLLPASPSLLPVDINGVVDDVEHLLLAVGHDVDDLLRLGRLLTHLVEIELQLFLARAQRRRVLRRRRRREAAVVLEPEVVVRARAQLHVRVDVVDGHLQQRASRGTVCDVGYVFTRAELS